jgi:hypothetical protein
MPLFVWSLSLYIAAELRYINSGWFRLTQRLGKGAAGIGGIQLMTARARVREAVRTCTHILARGYKHVGPWPRRVRTWPMCSRGWHLAYSGYTPLYVYIPLSIHPLSCTPYIHTMYTTPAHAMYTPHNTSCIVTPTYTPCIYIPSTTRMHMAGMWLPRPRLCAGVGQLHLGQERPSGACHTQHNRRAHPARMRPVCPLQCVMLLCMSRSVYDACCAGC